jgi:large subunit ribosomal protein L30
MTEQTITVTQTRSAIGAKPKTRGTLRALGLGRIGKTNTLPDRPEIRGMIARVPHLIAIDADGPQGSTKANQSGQAGADAVVEQAADDTSAAAATDEAANEGTES